MYPSENSFGVVVLSLDDVLLYFLRVEAQHLVWLDLKVVVEGLHIVEVVLIDLRSDLLLSQRNLQDMSLETNVFVGFDQILIVHLGHLLSHDDSARLQRTVYWYIHQLS